MTGNCSICFGDENDGDLIRLDCNHTFHRDCVRQQLDSGWAGTRVTLNYLNCAMCRTEMSITQDTSNPEAPIVTSAANNLRGMMKPHLDLKRIVADKVRVSPPRRSSLLTQARAHRRTHMHAYMQKHKCNTHARSTNENHHQPSHRVLPVTCIRSMGCVCCLCSVWSLPWSWMSSRTWQSCPKMMQKIQPCGRWLHSSVVLANLSSVAAKPSAERQVLKAAKSVVLPVSGARSSVIISVTHMDLNLQSSNAIAAARCVAMLHISLV